MKGVGVNQHSVTQFILHKKGSTILGGGNVKNLSDVF